MRKVTHHHLIPWLRKSHNPGTLHLLGRWPLDVKQQQPEKNTSNHRINASLQQKPKEKCTLDSRKQEHSLHTVCVQNPLPLSLCQHLPFPGKHGVNPRRHTSRGKTNVGGKWFLVSEYWRHWIHSSRGYKTHENHENIWHIGILGEKIPGFFSGRPPMDQWEAIGIPDISP